MTGSIFINPQISLDAAEIEEEFMQSGGPGGQNVNKVASGVRLRFNVLTSPELSEDVRHRLVNLAGNRMTNDCVLVIEARQFRTQEQNRQAALERLVRLIQAALVPPRVRKKTRPSQASRERRLAEKKRRSENKRLRSRIHPDGV